MSNFKRVGDFVKRSPVTVDSSLSIRETAKIMDEERISSVVVTRNGAPYAFFTESDLRRVVGEEIDLGKPVGEFAGTRLIAVSSNSSIFDALSLMVQHGIKHLGVFEDGELIGVITLRDVAFELGPKYIKYTARIHGAKRLEDIALAMDSFKLDLEREAMSYVDHPEIVDPYVFFSEISHVVDAMIVTAAKLIGMPADGYAYAITGSGGRSEQLLLTDRDTLAVYSDDDVLEWFAKLERTLDSLGFPGCDHGYTSDKYNFHVSQVGETCREWSTNVEKNIVNLSLISDSRFLLGERSLLEEMKECLASKLEKNRFVIIASLRYKPALTIFGSLKEIFNYKAGAIAPVEYPVRALAITNGIMHVTNTLERIRTLVEERIIPEDMGDDLEHAYTILMRRKIWLQAQNRKEFQSSEVNPMERTLIRDALKTVKRFQGYVERNFI
ncbi:MAG: CBS domain-containing protein [Archaeoglobi archaeon]|nr:CBS domain-containing protein [Archaeoglobi archaeon]